LKALIVKALSVISARSILDVCCGTGRYSIEIAKRLNLHLVGIDKSHKMIDEAMVKYPRAEWICGDILKILKNLRASSYDIILFAYCFHLIDWINAVNFLSHLVKDNGIVLILTYAPEIFSKALYHSYIPELVEIDKKRFPNITEIISVMRTSGYEVNSLNISESFIIQKRVDVKKVIHKAQAKYCSTLWDIEENIINQRIKSMEHKLLSEIETGKVTFIHDHTLIACVKRN
jgi:SAM-dependent methyltransferase